MLISFLLGICQLVLILILRELCTFFHNGCISLNSYQQWTRVHFPHSLTHTRYLLSFLFSPFDNNHSNTVKYSIISVLIYISLISVVNVFSYSCWPFVCLLLENIYSDPLHILKSFSFSPCIFCCWVTWVLYIFWILTLYFIYAVCKYSSIL